MHILDVYEVEDLPEKFVRLAHNVYEEGSSQVKNSTAITN